MNKNERCQPEEMRNCRQDTNMRKLAAPLTHSHSHTHTRSCCLLALQLWAHQQTVLP